MQAELKAVNEKWEDGKTRGRTLYAQNQATIDSLQAQLNQSLVVVSAKPAKKPRQKSASCLMSESHYAMTAPFREAFTGTDYEHADLNYYHEVIYNWSLSKGEKRTDWIATAKGWMLRDSKKNELKTNPNSKALPNEHALQQQSARAQQLGLIDEAKRDAARELLRAHGLR